MVSGVVALLAAGCGAEHFAVSPGQRAQAVSAVAPRPLSEASPVAASDGGARSPDVAPSEEYGVGEEGSLDDDFEEPATEEASRAPPRPHPLDGLTNREIEEKLRTEPASLGSMSLGVPSGGALFNGVQLPPNDRWELVDAAHAWGTHETVDYLTRAIAKVHAQFPNAPKLYIGHISAKNGGHLSPHVSHQAGRDVDVGYFYSDPDARWYARASAKNLDLPKTWSLVRALVTETDAELILIDQSIQALLRRYAEDIGEDETWLEELFHGRPGKLRPLIVHAKGHGTHLHVRFYNPIAQETARRTYEPMLRRGLIQPPTYYVSHKAKKGETLGMLARKYHVDVAAIKRANGLKKNLIRADRVYKIPKKGNGVRAMGGRVAIPERRLPPSTPVVATSR